MGCFRRASLRHTLGMPPAASPLIALSNVSVVFGNGTQALDQVSISVPAGEFLTLLGPSGCGKSTLLRLVAGLERPSTGTVDAPALSGTGSAETAFVFQDPTLMPWATLFDNVWLPLRLAGVSRSGAQARVETVLNAVGLADFSAA